MDPTTALNEMIFLSRQLISSATNDERKDQLSYQTQQSHYLQMLENSENIFNHQISNLKRKKLLNNRITTLQNKISDRDYQLQLFLKRLKRSEQLLCDVLNEAKYRLSKIKLAEKSNISTDELVRYSYIISRAESVAAPIDWQPGDQRRPFPTEIQMNQGILPALNDTLKNKDPVSIYNQENNIGTVQQNKSLVTKTDKLITSNKMMPIVHKMDDDVENKMDEFMGGIENNELVESNNNNKRGGQENSDSEGSDEWGWNYK